MNKTNILLMDRPVSSSVNSSSHFNNNNYFKQQANFHDVLKRQVVPKNKELGNQSYDAAVKVKKFLNQINSPSKEINPLIKDLANKLQLDGNIKGLENIDESLLSILLLALTKNDFSLVEDMLSEENFMKLIEHLELLISSKKMNFNDEVNANYNNLLDLLNHPTLSDLSEEMIAQLQLLAQNITELLASISGQDKDFSQVSNRLLSLLEQWMNLTKEEKSSINKTLRDSLSEEGFKRWEKLTDIFSKRMAQQNKGNYHSEATVSTKDLAKWLEHIVSESSTVTAMSSSQDLGRPMTQIEQFVLHVQASDRVERVSREFMQKMTQIVQQSQFTKPGNQVQQLSLMIRPENLGNMTLHFTQMNGDMIVKIMVSSQMAREMLESNIHQLKHLFAPHQVVIERDTTISDEQFFNQEYEEEPSDHEESMDEMKDEEDSNNDQDSERIDFESLLQMTVEGG